MRWITRIDEVAVLPCRGRFIVTQCCGKAGTTKISRLEENLGAVSVGLSAEEARELEEAAAAIEVVGERCPEASRRLIDR